MTEELVDPRHSAAFQRGYAGSSPLSGQFSPSRPGALASPPPAAAREVTPPTRARRRSESASAHPVIADPFEAVVEIDESAETPGTVAVVEQTVMADDRDRRLFLAWTLALFLIGIGLCIASFVLFSEYNYTRWSTIQSTSDGQWTVTTMDNSEMRTISEFEYYMYLFMSQNAAWLGVIGLATIVGNLFRIAPRRPRTSA